MAMIEERRKQREQLKQREQRGSEDALPGRNRFQGGGDDKAGPDLGWGRGSEDALPGKSQ